jgi:hypothetical protein
MPIINYKLKDIDFEAGWFIREFYEHSNRDKGKVKFIIKGRNQDFTIDYEFRDESLGLGLLCEEEPKITK